MIPLVQKPYRGMAGTVKYGESTRTNAAAPEISAACEEPHDGEYVLLEKLGEG